MFVPPLYGTTLAGGRACDQKHSIHGKEWYVFSHVRPLGKVVLYDHQLLSKDWTGDEEEDTAMTPQREFDSDTDYKERFGFESNSEGEKRMTKPP